MRLMERDIRYIISLLENPVESDKTEYKRAIQFQENTDFSIKLVKHILGFANSGGGHIVIGFAEGNQDKVLQIDGALNNSIIKSYEVTRLCQYVNSILGTQDRIDINIIKAKYGDKTFPVIYIAPFVRRPFFCKRDVMLTNGEKALEEGTIYIRVAGAQTVKVAGAGDWDKLISQCVEAEYETFLTRAKNVLLNLRKRKEKIVKESRPLKSLSEARKSFLKKMKE